MSDKEKLEVDQRVEFARTGDKDLDGIKGTILGMPFEYAEVDFYIVLLDEPIKGSKEKAVLAIDSTLDKV